MGCFNFFSVIIIAAIIYHVIKALTKSGDVTENNKEGWDDHGTGWTGPAGNKPPAPFAPPAPPAPPFPPGPFSPVDGRAAGLQENEVSVTLQSRQGNVFARIQVRLKKTLPDGLVIQSRLSPNGPTNTIAETFDSVFVAAGRSPDLISGWITPAAKHALVKAWTEGGGGFWLKEGHVYADIPVSGVNDPKINMGVEVLKQMVEDMLDALPTPGLDPVSPQPSGLSPDSGAHVEPAVIESRQFASSIQVGGDSGALEKVSLGPPPDTSGVPAESILAAIESESGMGKGFDVESQIRSEWSGRVIWGRGRVEYCRKIFGVDVDFGIPGGCKITVKPEKEDSVLAPKLLIHIPHLEKEVLVAGTRVAYSGKLEEYRPALRCLLLIDGRVQVLR